MLYTAWTKEASLLGRPASGSSMPGSRGLAMSRALGDKIAHTVGVISEPGISVLELYPADQFIILASDGVWEFIDKPAGG
eukprot:jgi/Tetstr1/422523/TSEL_001284.t1